MRQTCVPWASIRHTPSPTGEQVDQLLGLPPTNPNLGATP